MQNVPTLIPTVESAPARTCRPWFQIGLVHSIRGGVSTCWALMASNYSSVFRHILVVSVAQDNHAILCTKCGQSLTFSVPCAGCVSFEALALLGVFVLRFLLVAERRMSKGWRCVVETACMAHCRAQRRPPPSAACPPCISSQID